MVKQRIAVVGSGIAGLAAAIWSTGTGGAGEFPRDILLRFFANHGLLSLSEQPQWRTVVGGSSTYIAAMTRGLTGRIHSGCGVERVERTPGEVVVHLADGNSDRFDQVVIAAHADQALTMLADPSPADRGGVVAAATGPGFLTVGG